MLILALWFACMGVWPLWDPRHDGRTLFSQLDLLVHVVAAVVAVNLMIKRHFARMETK